MAVLPAGHLVTQVFPATRLTSGPAEMTHASKRTEAAERDASSIGGVVARASEVRTVNRHDGDLGHREDHVAAVRAHFSEKALHYAGGLFDYVELGWWCRAALTTTFQSQASSVPRARKVDLPASARASTS